MKFVTVSLSWQVPDDTDDELVLDTLTESLRGLGRFTLERDGRMVMTNPEVRWAGEVARRTGD